MRNRYSPLTVDESLPPLPPSAEGHRVIELEERSVAPVEKLRTPSPVSIVVPSSKQEEQGSIHEVSIASLVFDSSANHMVLYISWMISRNTSTSKGNKNRSSPPVLVKNCPTKHLRLGALILKYVKLHSSHANIESYALSQLDNVRTLHWLFKVPMADGVTPPVERAESIPEVRHLTHVAFPTFFSDSVVI